MFVKYGAGRSGIENYLINGQSKNRSFSRNELDHRIILNGNLDDVSLILKQFNKPNAKGDNYKHFVINFKERDLSIETIKNIDSEFKTFITSGYKQDELYYYSEIHYPKIWGYQLKNNDFLIRKPHVHVIIPVFNLYTGNKGFNFNYHTYDFNEYLKSFSKYINNKYKLISPYIDENRQLISNNSIQIEKKSGKKFSNINIEIKNTLLQQIIKNNISTQEDLKKYILKNIHNIKFKMGNLNKEMFIIEKDNKDIILKDFCFSNEFLKLPKIKKEFLYSNYLNHYENDLNNQIKLSLEPILPKDSKNINDFKNVISKVLKYSKIINKKEFSDFSMLKTEQSKQQFLLDKEQRFYERTNNSRRNFRNEAGNEEYFNYIKRNISTAIGINSVTKKDFRNFKSKPINVDINILSKEIFLKILEIRIGFCSQSIKIKNNSFIFGNKQIDSNLNLIKELPILMEDKIKFINIIKYKFKQLYFIDNHFNKSFNFYNTHKNSDFIKDILNKYLLFKSNSKPVQVNILLENFYDFKRLDKNIFKNFQSKDFEINIINNKYKNLTKLKRIKLKATKNIYQNENALITKIKYNLKKYLMKELNEVNGNTIIDKKFIYFLASFFNENHKSLSVKEKQEIISFLLISNTLNDNETELNQEFLEKILNFEEIDKINEKGDIVLSDQLVNINKNFIVTDSLVDKFVRE